MEKVRAKFKCDSVENTEYGSKVKFTAVCSDKGENQDICSATPNGNCEMWIEKGYPAAEYFEPGGEYYLNFEKA